MILRKVMLITTVALVGLGAGVAGAAERTTTEKAKDTAEAASNAMSDSWITMKTKLSLMADERVSATDVKVTTKQGIVTLQGKVPSAEAKQVAEADATQIDGVKQVINKLAVVPPSAEKAVERKDEQITQDVESRVKREKTLQNARIDVETTNGIVTLTGDAPSLQASVRASEVAHRVPGVRAVHNELSVKDKSARK
jgi:hyperosmotically inducible periplasmic protein